MKFVFGRENTRTIPRLSGIIRSCEEGVIPPFSSRFIQVAAEQRKRVPDGAYMIQTEHSPGTNHQIYAPNGVYEFKDGKVMVLLSNLKPAPLTIPIGESVGNFSHIHEDNPQQEANRQVNNVMPIQTFSKSALTNASCLIGDVSLGSSLNESEKEKILSLLDEYHDVFATDKTQIGAARNCNVNIELLDRAPVNLAPHRHSVEDSDIIEEIVNDLKKKGIVEDSSSPYSSPVVLVKKEGKDPRLCIDFRGVNMKVKRNAYPIPRCDEAIDTLRGSKYFSAIDLNSGFHQLPLNEESKEITAFNTGRGLFQFTRLPFGLNVSANVFQSLMDATLAGLKWWSCIVYIDDVITFSHDFATHLIRLRQVFDRFRTANLTLKPSKCMFCTQTIEFLGHTIDSEGIRPSRKKVESILDLTPPTDEYEARAFLGACSFYRKFIENFSKRIQPISSLFTIEGIKEWTPLQQQSYEDIKTALCTEPVLVHFDNTKNHELRVDACNIGLGAVLLQEEEKGWKVVEYASRMLNIHEKNYSVTEWEMLAVVFAVRKFHSYLSGHHFVVVVDHCGLTFIMKKRDLPPRLARWALILQEYDFTIVYKKGKCHKDADFLSRHPTCDEVDYIDEEKMFINPIVFRKDLSKVKSEQNQDKMIKTLKQRVMALGGVMKDLVLENGILYRMVELPMDVKQVPFLPSSMVEEVLKDLHDDVFSGHMGYDRTVHRVRNRYWWPSLAADVKRFVQSCYKCQSRKRIYGKQQGLLRPHNTHGPLEMLCCDFQGPLVMTKRKNRYILLLIDHFTKFAWARALKSATSEAVAEVLLDYISMFGTPKVLLSDNGSQFIAGLTEALLKKTGIRHALTTPYTPAQNGLCERLNSTFLDMLSKYINAKQNDWDVYLNYLIFAYNSSVQESTKLSPFNLMFGREGSFPGDIQMDPLGLEDPQDFGDVCFARMREMKEYVNENLEKARERQKDLYDKRHKDIIFEIGQEVSILRPAVKPGLKRKLALRWEGPFIVRKRIGFVVYGVQSVDGKKYHLVHVSRIKKFYKREEGMFIQKPDEQSSESEDSSSDDDCSSGTISRSVSEQSMPNSEAEVETEPKFLDEEIDETIINPEEAKEDSKDADEPSEVFITPSSTLNPDETNDSETTKMPKLKRIPKDLSTSTPHGSKALCETEEQGRTKRVTQKPKKLTYDALGHQMFLLMTIMFVALIGESQTISPLFNHTFLSCAGSHGLRLTRFGNAYVFDGFWSQLIEIQVPQTINMLTKRATIDPEATCRVKAAKNDFAFGMCDNWAKSSNSIANATLNYQIFLNHKLNQVFKTEPTNDDQFPSRNQRKQKMDRRRGRRYIGSVIPLVGDALKVLFGTSTSSDFDRLQNKFIEMEDTMEDYGKDTVILKEELLGLSKIMDENGAKIKRAMVDMGKQVNDMEIRFTEEIIDLEKDLQDAMSVVNDFNEAMNYGLLALYNLTLTAQAVDDVEEYFVQLRQAKLPVSLLPWNELQPILEEIDKAVKPFFKIGIPEEDWKLYYILPLTRFALLPDGIILRLTVPLASIDSDPEHKIIAPITSPIPCTESVCSWFGRIEASDAYVTLLMKDRGWLTGKDEEHLKGEVDLSTFTCITEGDKKTCFTFDPSFVRVPSLCTQGLWTWQRDRIIQSCQFELSLRESYKPIKVSDDTWLVHKENVPHFNMICPGHKAVDKTLTEWAEAVVVENGCYFQAGSFKIYGPLRFRDSRLDTIRASTPEFLFGTNQIIPSAEPFIAGERPVKQRKAVFNLTQVENSLQLDQRAVTSVTNRLWLESDQLRSKIKKMERHQQMKTHKLSLLTIMHLVSKIMVTASIFGLVLVNVRFNRWFFGISPLITYVRRTDAQATEDSVTVWDTINLDPTDYIVSVGIFITIIIGFYLVKRFKWFLGVEVSEYHGKVERELEDDEEESGKEYLFHSIHSQGTWRKCYKSEININIPMVQERLKFNNDGAMRLQNPLKSWQVKRRKIGRKFDIGIEIHGGLVLGMSDRGKEIEIQDDLFISFASIIWGTTGPPLNLWEGSSGEALIQVNYSGHLKQEYRDRQTDPLKGNVDPRKLFSMKRACASAGSPAESDEDDQH